MLKVKVLNPLATPPTINHEGEDLGYDVYALRIQHQLVQVNGTPVPFIPPRPGMPMRLDPQGKTVHPIRLESGRPLKLDTGIALTFVGPEDGRRYGLLVRDRSSMAARGIFVTGGVIDAGYTGELKITLNLLSGSYQDIWPGDKVAQLIPIPVFADEVKVVETLDESSRQEEGFGSSGQ